MPHSEGGFCPVGGERPLTPGEIALARSIFGTEIDYAPVRIRRRKWIFFQPSKVTMAPLGHLHFHPRSQNYCDDFATASIHLQGHFIHEMVHVWQAQKFGRWWLIFNRLPWEPYEYSLRPGWPLNRYGVEQQAEIVKHAFLLRNGMKVAGVADASAYDLLVRFSGTRPVAGG